MSTILPLAYLNGRYVPIEQASVPVTDRGLLFGDSVYEVIPVYGGHPFRVHPHLARLQRSLEAIGLTNPLSAAQWQEVVCVLADQLPDGDQQIYLQVTRGSYPGRDHRIPAEVQATTIAFSMPQRERDPTIPLQGQKAITQTDIRWHRCDIKTTALLGNVLLQQAARETGADEAILLRDGEATEGTATNLFIVSQGLIITPPESDQLLSGVTRDLVLELAREAGLPFALARISAEDLVNADEIWLTSATREVAPVVELDGKPVANGRPGPIWEHMNQLFEACKTRLRLTGECHE